MRSPPTSTAPPEWSAGTPATDPICGLYWWSWDQPLAIDRLLHLVGKLVGGRVRVDGGDRRERRRDSRRYRLVHRCEWTHRGVRQLAAEDLVGRVLELKLWIVVQRRPHGRQAALDREVLLILCAAQAANGLERLGLVLRRLRHGQVQPAQCHLGRTSRLHAGIGREAEHRFGGVVGGGE